jgi:hypothetical protein
LQLGDGLIGQVVLGAQVGSESGESVGVDEARLGVEISDLDVHRPCNLP